MPQMVCQIYWSQVQQNVLPMKSQERSQRTRCSLWAVTDSTKNTKMERRVRDSFGWGIAGGTIDVQKVNIASAMIGRRFNQRAK